MDNILQGYYTIKDIKIFIEETEATLGFDDEILNHNPDRIKLNRLKELYAFYSFATLCDYAIQILKSILNKVDDLDEEDVRVWVDSNIPFFKEHLFSFGYTYTDKDGNQEKDFYLPDYGIYIERTAYVPVIIYWKLMWNLYNGQYHKLKKDRIIESADPKDFYYVEPDPNGSSDLDVAKIILNN